jgi:hypothetical protein
MSIKTDKVKSYLSEIGSKKQRYLLLGTKQSTTSEDNSNTSSINLWRDSQITYRIGKNDVVGIVPNVTWRESLVFTPWTSSTTNSGSFYSYNKTNGIVYLCLSDNVKNRIDLKGKSASTIIPTHTSGIVRYNDGYEWLALYKITPDISKFVTNSWIPVISLNDFEFDTSLTKYSELLSFCDGSSGAYGNCGVYFKQNTQIPATNTTFTTYLSGDLYSTITNTTCGECYHMFDGDDNFVSVFYGSSEPDSSISIKDKLDEIGEYVNNNELASSSPYYQLYNMAINSPNDGALLSCFVDLSQFTEENLIVTEPNPSLTITTATGSGASINFTTYISSSGSYVIDGIQITNRGSGYYDADLSISSSIFPNVDADLILSTIQLNFDKIDNIGVDPISTLECKHISTDVKISVDQLRDNSITIPSQIDFYGFVENPLLTTDDDEIVSAGKTISKYQSSVQTNNTKIKITKTGGSSPTIGSSIILNNNTTSNTMSSLSVVNATDETVSDITLELNGVDNTALNNFSLDSNSISISDGENSYTVTEYVSVPPIVQYSGNISLTKSIQPQVLSSTSGELSKIIRINRIEAL